MKTTCELVLARFVDKSSQFAGDHPNVGRRTFCDKVGDRVLWLLKFDGEILVEVTPEELKAVRIRRFYVCHLRTDTRREHVPVDFDVESEDPTGESLVDLRPALKHFIAELPVAYREPLVLHEFQGEPLEDVARALGLSLTATKSRVRRARLMLREMLDRCCRFEFDSRGRVIEAKPRSACPCDN